MDSDLKGQKLKINKTNVLSVTFITNQPDPRNIKVETKYINAPGQSELRPVK